MEEATIVGVLFHSLRLLGGVLYDFSGRDGWQVDSEPISNGLAVQSSAHAHLSDHHRDKAILLLSTSLFFPLLDSCTSSSSLIYNIRGAGSPTCASSHSSHIRQLPLVRADLRLDTPAGRDSVLPHNRTFSTPRPSALIANRTSEAATPFDDADETRLGDEAAM